MSEWILCEDRLPDARRYDLTMKELLVMKPCGRVSLANFINGKFAKWDYELLEWHYMDQDSIKAWAEIPELPEDGGNCDGRNEEA